MNCDRRKRKENNIHACNLASWKSCTKKCENIELKCLTNGGRKNNELTEWVTTYMINPGEIDM